MDTRERLASYGPTQKQQEFEWDFTRGVDGYEVWDEIVIGDSQQSQNDFTVTLEDILSFNRSCLETDPRMIDPEVAEREGVLIHPLFVVQIAFFCIGNGIGSWIRTPGARNPGQSIELYEEFAVGERITCTVTHHDKWIRRGNFYMEDRLDFCNPDGAEKARWFVRLLLPPNREAVRAFAAK